MQMKLKNYTLTLCLLALMLGLGSGVRAQTAPNAVANNILWLKADSITGVANNASLTTWTDSSPTGLAWTGSGTYLSSSIGGKPAVSFTGKYQPSSSASFNALSGSGYSFLFVVKTSSSAAVNTVMCKGAGANKQMFFATGISAANGKFGRYGDLEGSANTADGVPHILSYTITAPSGGNTTEKIWQDGVLVGTRTGAAATFDAAGVMTIGRTSGDTFLFSGQIAEILAYSSTISDTDRQNLELYESSKYTIAVTEPNAPTPSIGAVTLTAPGPSSFTLTAPAATGGTAPYTYQWYRSLTSQSALGTAVSGATSLTLTDTPPTADVYYYRLVVTDSTAQTYTSAQTPALLFAGPLEIGFIGDSITQGTGSSGSPAVAVAQAWLQHYLGPRTVTVINQGYPGTAVTDATWSPPSGADYTAALAAFGPPSQTPYICLNLGVNDANSSHFATAAAYKAALTALVNALTTAGYIVLLNQPTYTVPGTQSGTWTETSDALIDSYSAQQDSLINGTSVLRGDRSGFRYFASHTGELGDGVHPNQVGHYSLGNLWGEAFARATGIIPSVKLPSRRLQ